MLLLTSYFSLFTFHFHIGAIAGPWPFVWVGAADVRPFGIDGAEAGGGVEEDAIVVRPSGEGEFGAGVVEMLDKTRLFEPLGDGFGGGRFRFKRGDEFHVAQIV